MQEILTYIVVIFAVVFLLKKFVFKSKSDKNCNTNCNCSS
ncbi:FeoB-associated Cys-rich membrane protein [Tenacibaculum tangerinum]|uniref:FeoB-associated Cys-rich membrane protein n=1 Tax=Tenacibaculum tangerinum TaxID=3038772 RepID=A0ABY8KZU7_9FLAO|nr:FeoB-associated Cys-rich membrane protein [Tenacibaculum tangerinum]WGH74541.1 FeoB-associated Cys-rich membrane protein [Tenacibaculum tangerinum]